MHTLTLAQLKEDIGALASAHPACFPTNVSEVSHICGEICVEVDTMEEDELREELKAAESALEEAEKEAKSAEERATTAEEEAQKLREEMELLHDGEETVSTYRERTLAAEKQTETFRQFMVQARQQVQEAHAETKALRARKGHAAGIYRNIQKIRSLLCDVAQRAGNTLHVATAAEILRDISA